jgi:tripartite-type tricarboxylate transporter receptor subunit TctC
MFKAFLLLLVLILAACAGPELTEPQREMPARVYLEYRPDVSMYGVVDGTWPDAPLTVVVPFLAGGDTDRFARLFAPFLSEHFGWPVNIVNIDGDSGNVGARHVLEAAPDGYTILFYHTGDLFANLMVGMRNAVRADQFAVAAVAIHCEANVMVASAAAGFNCATCFLDYARENPGGLRTAMVADSFMHVVLNKAELAADFETEIVNVGSARLKADAVLGGHADVTYNNVALFMPYIEDGRMVPLWVASSARNPLLPDVPTLVELGYPAGLLGRSYFYAFPPGTDPEIVESLSAAVAIAARDRWLLAQLAEMGAAPPAFVPSTEVEAYLQIALREFMVAMP